MNEFVIVTDSSSDLPIEVANDMGVRIISLEVNIEGEGTKLNCDVDTKDFYEKLRSKRTVTTSAANVEQFSVVFEELAKEGKDVLYMGFSSGLSSTYNSGKLACEEIAEKYPDRKLLATDTLCASLGQGLLVDLAVQKKNSGATIEEVWQYVEDNKLHLCHWFTVDDLFFLKRGGRVSAATAVLGSMLAIKPVMHVDNEGHLINVAKARGRQAAIKALFDKMVETAIEPEGQKIYICHGDCYEDAKYLADMVTEKFGIKDIFIGYTGPVIGAHSGPGTLALFFVGTER